MTTQIAFASRPAAVLLAIALCAQGIPAGIAYGSPYETVPTLEETPALAGDVLSAESAASEGAQSYEQLLSDRAPSGWSVGWGKLETDVGVTGAPISLLRDGVETPFERGVAAHAPSKVTYNDIQDYGYERFEAWVGIDQTARNSASKVEFKVIGDGEVKWRSGEMDSKSDAVFASVDIEGVSVVQLVVEALDKGSAPNNHSIWADARFVKSEASPWLRVSDKVFSIPDQVTEENILEGVFARTLSGEPGKTDAPVVGSDGTLRNGKEGNDLSDEVTYTTDYVPGQTGNFALTYRVVDAQGIERSRTVNMSVLGTQRYETDADLDRLTTPFANFLYSARDYFDEEGKKAFDLSVETLLGFGDSVDSYPLISHWGEEVYQVTVRLQDAGIWMGSADAGYLASAIMDNEPRAFHMKDWGTAVTVKDGMADTVTFYVAKRYGQKDDNGMPYYHTRLLQAEANASRFLAKASEDMTDAQRLRAVLYPYADWIKYEGGGQTMDEALADGRSVCGGNARGSVYLCQRMGIKAYWVRTDSHAWSNVKLNHDDSGVSDGTYFRVDLLARPGCFLSVDAEHQGFHGHHSAVHFNRSKGYPDMTSQGYPFAWTAWPSLALDVEQSVVVLAPQDAGRFDPRSLVEVASSIYQGPLYDAVEIDDGGLSENMADGMYAPGFYTLAYSLADGHGRNVVANAYVHVVDGEVISAESSSCSDNQGSTFEAVSLWSGSEEVPYKDGIRQNEARSVTFDVAGKGYTHFDAWVGINGTVRANVEYGMNGKVQLEVWARLESGEDVKLASSPVMGWKAKQEHLLVSLPENAVSVTLKNVPKGAGNNHAAWGNPRFFTSEVLSEVPTPPAVLHVENGAVYSTSVLPVVEKADSVELYRKAIPVVVDPSTGLPEESASSASVLSVGSVSHEWGDLVEGYESGHAIEGEGVYTIVASNRFGQRTVVSFSIVGGVSEGPGGSTPGTGDGVVDGGDLGDPDNEPDVPNVGGSVDGEGPSDDGISLEDGSSLTISHDSDGNVSFIGLEVSEQALQAGSVVLPIDPVSAASGLAAPMVSISVPSNGRVSVRIPVVNPAKTVLVLVSADGTERVLPKTAVVDGAISYVASGEETFKLVEKEVSFPDVFGDEWYSESGVVDFVAARGILSGVLSGDGTALFSGDSKLTRGMLVTMLHRIESEPLSENAGFLDVDSSSWYSDSSSWAAESGVAEGYCLEDGSVLFAGDDAVTREQIATFCYRYAKLLGIDVSERVGLGAFSDSKDVSWWASDAMSWAVAVGLVKGDGDSGTLRPTDEATRAEAAAIAMRLVGLYAG